MDNAIADGKDEYDFNGDNDEPNEIEQDDTALTDDFKGDNDETNEKKECIENKSEKNRNDNKSDNTTLKVNQTLNQNHQK